MENEGEEDFNALLIDIFEMLPISLARSRRGLDTIRKSGMWYERSKSHDGKLVWLRAVYMNYVYTALSQIPTRHAFGSQ